MSFEGFYQVICEKGHSYAVDAYGPEPHEAPCPTCRSRAQWWNMVDTTNGSWDEKGKRIDGHVSLSIKKKGVTEKCPHCGVTKIISQATCKVPKGKGWTRRRWEAGMRRQEAMRSGPAVAPFALECDPPPSQEKVHFHTRRTKKLSEVTAKDIPPGLDAEDVATDTSLAGRSGTS